MKLNFKFNATKIEEIEKSKGTPIEACLDDSTISNISMFVQKGLVDENGIHGVSKAVAMSTIDEYLKESDKEDLFIDIMEALVNDGFLSRTLNIQAMREMKKKKSEEITKAIKKM
ncbi:MAG: hypothetical protein FWF46_07560 [Oscillospiraceae bacterium]|nr:hypothetical protein [Oscillospiraceae bacterium]